MVRGVAGRVDGLEAELGRLDQRRRRASLRSTSRPSRASERQDLGAGARLQAGRTRRVVGVGVGAHDPADAIAAAAGDGVEVLGGVGTRVDHRDLVDADQVGVGARAGHHARVGRDDAPHQRAQRPGDARHQRRRGCRLLIGIDRLRRLTPRHGHLPPSTAGTGWSCVSGHARRAAPPTPGRRSRGRRAARCAARPASSTMRGRIVGHLADGGGRGQQVVGRWRSARWRSRLRTVGKIISNSPARWARQRVGRGGSTGWR